MTSTRSEIFARLSASEVALYRGLFGDLPVRLTPGQCEQMRGAEAIEQGCRDRAVLGERRGWIGIRTESRANNRACDVSLPFIEPAVRRLI